MRPKLLCRIAASIGLLLVVTPMVAHHSFIAEFDQNKPITLQGVVTKVEWMNPHIYLYIEVKDANGNIVNWGLEGGPPNSLYRQGWRKDSLKTGDAITVSAFRAKDGSNIASMRTVTTPDGRKVFAGTADDGGPKQ